MAVTEAYSGSETVSTTEWSMTTDTSGPDIATTAGAYQAYIDLNALLKADLFRFRAYEKVLSSSTQRVVFEMFFANAQSTPNVVVPTLMLLNGWDMTLLKITGTDRAIDWSIRKAG